MAARKTIEKPARRRATIDATPYLAAGNEKDLPSISTGCALFDEALGGGPVLGRVFNLIGDSGAGKTQVAMELLAQFLRAYGNQAGAWARYAEAEAAWDEAFARDALGIDTSQIILNKKGERIETMEEWWDDLLACLDKYDGPGVYVLDSLDAISDEDERKAGFGEASYGGKKPKLVSQLFRRICGRLEEQKVLLLVISQTRDAIGVMFGPQKTRSGGKALQFYSTHVAWLREVRKIKRTVGEERVVGIDVEAYVTKNKSGLCFRKAQYPILFGYGIDDLTASAEWLCGIGRDRLLAPLGMRKKTERAKTRQDVAEKSAKEKADPLPPYDLFIREVRDRGGQEAQALRKALTALVRQEWARIELEFLPKAKKY